MGTRRGRRTTEEQLALIDLREDLGPEEEWEYIRRVIGMNPGRHVSNLPKKRTASPKDAEPAPVKLKNDHLFDGEAWIARRNEIVVQNLAWARGIAERIARRLPTWFCADDLMGHAEIALIRVADQYAAYQNVPFRAFAIQRLRGACYDAVRRREYKERGHVSIDGERHKEYFMGTGAGYGGEGTAEIQRATTYTGPSPERLAELEQMKGIWAYTYRLPAKHGLVIRLIYGDGKSGSEAAKKLKLSEARVSTLRREGLEMLKELVKR